MVYINLLMQAPYDAHEAIYETLNARTWSANIKTQVKKIGVQIGGPYCGGLNLLRSKCVSYEQQVHQL